MNCYIFLFMSSSLCLVLILSANSLYLSNNHDKTIKRVEHKSSRSDVNRLPRHTASKKKDTRRAKTKWLNECLIEHNKYRRLHGVPDLKWDHKLAKFAQKRSNHIANSDGDKFGHPPDLIYGENLFWHSSNSAKCAKMIRGWYDEIEEYNFKKPSFSGKTGHFTQLIWRSTSKIGCAKATSSGKRGGVYLTCNYDPPGNFLGEFKENVPFRSRKKKQRKKKSKKKKKNKKEDRTS